MPEHRERLWCTSPRRGHRRQPTVLPSRHEVQLPLNTERRICEPPQGGNGHPPLSPARERHDRKGARARLKSVLDTFCKRSRENSGESSSSTTPGVATGRCKTRPYRHVGGTPRIDAAELTLEAVRGTTGCKAVVVTVSLGLGIREPAVVTLTGAQGNDTQGSPRRLAGEPRPSRWQPADGCAWHSWCADRARCCVAPAAPSTVCGVRLTTSSCFRATARHTSWRARSDRACASPAAALA